MVFDYLVDFLTMMFVLMLFVASIFSPRPGDRRSRRMRRTQPRQVADAGHATVSAVVPDDGEGLIPSDLVAAPATSFADDSKGTPSPA